MNYFCQLRITASSCGSLQLQICAIYELNRRNTWTLRILGCWFGTSTLWRPTFTFVWLVTVLEHLLPVCPPAGRRSAAQMLSVCMWTCMCDAGLNRWLMLAADLLKSSRSLFLCWSSVLNVQRSIDIFNIDQNETLAQLFFLMYIKIRF